MAVVGSQLYSFRYTATVFGTVFQPDTRSQPTPPN